MWKIRDRVKIIKSSKLEARLETKGSVVYIRSHQGRVEILIEFDDYIDGHQGASVDYGGKKGHCWWVIEKSQTIAAKDSITVEKMKRKNNYY